MAFAKLEDMAIDGQLNYDDFPPCEYKYFSKVAKLGYQNRHNGLSIDICNAKLSDYKTEYQASKNDIDKINLTYKEYQGNIRRGGTMLSDIEKSQDLYNIALKSVEAIGLMTGDDSFLKRQLKKECFKCDATMRENP